MNYILSRGFLFLLFCLSLQTEFRAQAFIQNKSNGTLEFREMQRQFADFKKTHDLKTEKYWKHFKRYEEDMQRHTNGHGEPDGFDTFLEEAIRASAAQNGRQAASSIWSPAGPNLIPGNLTGYMENGIGRVNCVGFHPTNPQIFYVGVAQGGVWKTTNGGTSYTPLTDQLPITRVSDICVDPVNPNTIYISLCDFEYIGKGLYLDGRKRHTHYGLGVYKSTDGGITWNPTGLAFTLQQRDMTLIRKILVNPSNNAQLLACGVNGMFRSTDGGTTWTKKLDSLFWDMEQDPVNPAIVYAATGWVKTANAGHAGIYKSLDFGNTWSLLNTGIPMQGAVQRIKLAISPTAPGVIYAVTTDLSDGLDGIYVSTDAGFSWVYKYPGVNILENGQGNSSGGQGPYDLAALVDPQDAGTLYVGGINVWGSQDSASFFQPATHWTLQFGSSTIHGDIHYMAKQPVSNAIFVCSDGGIYKTNSIIPSSWGLQWPTNWTNLSNGMQCTSFYKISSSKNTAGRLLAGAQDNASFYYNGNTWNTIFGGDGMDGYLDPLNNQDIIGSSQFGNFFYSNDGGQSGSFISSNPNQENSEWTTPIVADYAHPGVLYIGNENVAKSIDVGQTWLPLAPLPPAANATQNTEISALAVSASNSLVVYAARRVRYEFFLNGAVYKTVNGGSSFTNITSNLPDTLYYTSLDVNPTDANDVCITLSGFAAGQKVYRSTNGGATWVNVSYNLPNVSVNCVKYVPGTNQLMVACDVGLYIFDAQNNTWSSNSNGLPNVILTDIEFNPVLNKVYVATFGRGIWQTSLSSINSLFTRNSDNTPMFELFPSVSSGMVNVKLSNGAGKLDWEVVDIEGRVVKKGQFVSQSNALRLDLLPGCYFFRAEHSGQVLVKKIILQ